MFKFTCPSCQKPLSGTDELVGQVVECPFCRRCITVPASSDLPPKDPIPHSAWGKYTHWASGLDEDHLHGVLWAVGEYGVRARPILKCLGRHEAEFTPGLERAMLALDLLRRMVEGTRFSREEVMAEVRAAVARSRATVQGVTDGGVQRGQADSTEHK